MDNHRNQSRKNLNSFRFSWLLIFAGFFLSAALLIWIFSLIQPWLISSDYYQNSLERLRRRSSLIKTEFQQVLKNNDRKHSRLEKAEVPKGNPELFDFLKAMNSMENWEGSAYYRSSGELILWAGKVFDLSPIFFSSQKIIPSFSPKSTYLVAHKASYYLVSFQKKNGDYIFIYRLLAFIPEFKARYLQEDHFLTSGLIKNFDIDYWDFREDITGFERLFSRHKDEYIGQPRLQDQVQTIFFPLRNQKKNIVATVTLSSPPASARISSRKEDLSLFIYIFLITGFSFLLVYIYRDSLRNKISPAKTAAILLILPFLRALFIPLGKLQKVQSLTIFSPSTAGFISLGTLTQSPMDIFLTALFFSLIAAFSFSFLSKVFLRAKPRPSRSAEILTLIPALALSFGTMFFFQFFLSKLIFNSSRYFLHFTFDVSFFLLHLSILFAFAGVLVIIHYILKFAANLSHSKSLFYAVLLVFAALLLSSPPGDLSRYIIAFQILIIIWIRHQIHFSRIKHKKEFIAAGILISSVLIYISIHTGTVQKNNSILEYSLYNSIVTQDKWGSFLIQQSIPALNESREVIVSFFKNRIPPDPAQSLWEDSLMARFNWYSSLELISPGGDILSRFSLNVPELIFQDLDLPLSEEWTIRYQTIPVLGNEREFVIGYQDVVQAEKYLGRIRIILSIDNDMLPFLYSANPYYELLKPISIPSLQHLELGFAEFDQQGQILFNPHNLSKGFSHQKIESVMRSPSPVWMTFHDKGSKFRALLFDHHQRIYALFLPQKSFIDLSVEFIKLFFLYTACVSFGILLYFLLASGNIKNPFWSFSNRVYLSLIVISIIPLLIFTFSARDFFASVFTQRVTEEAEAQARFARRVMEDLLFLQQEEQSALPGPADNMVIWISSTITNDVNLYWDGLLVSSSHREFFDYGILPELIKGEIYYKIQYENNPFYTETQRIGEYSFHTLTVPYNFQDSVLLISLPFPLEQQEISRFTQDLFEFLLFLSFFIILAILVLARGLGGTIINPIRKLLAGTKEVGQGNLEVSIPYSHQDEMKTLIDGFNTMVNNLKKQQQELTEISKKLAWAEMSRKVAHEIKNPLTPIQLSAEHLLRVYEDRKEDFEKTLKESTSYIVSEVENLRRIAQEFLETSRQATVKKTPVDMKKIAEETIRPYQNILPERIQVDREFQGEQFVIYGDLAKIKIVLRNIFTNAIESIEKKGKIFLILKEKSDVIELSIEDTGKSIPPGDLQKIFEPYFSTKEGGTGLGLPIARKIILDHGGNIQARVNQYQGMTFTITLPKHSPSEKKKESG